MKLNDALAGVPRYLVFLDSAVLKCLDARGADSAHPGFNIDEDASPRAIKKAAKHVDSFAIKSLKRYLALGTPVAVSDSQVLSSYALNALFRDEQFRRFVQTSPDALQLVAQPRGEDRERAQDGRLPERLSLARSNYHNIVNTSWHTHRPDVEMPMKHLASLVLAGNDLDAESVHRQMSQYFKEHSSVLRANYPRHDVADMEAHAEGCIRALAHFAHTQGVPTSRPNGAFTTLWDVLVGLEPRRNALVSDTAFDEHRRSLDATRDFIERRVPSISDRTKRNLIENCIQNFVAGQHNAADRALYRSIMLTVYSAWNQAVATSLGPGGSFDVLFDEASCPVTLYAGTIDMVHRHERADAKPWHGVHKVFSFDAAELPWDKVGEMYKRMRDAQFSISREDDPAHQFEALESAATKAAKAVKPRPLQVPQVPGYVWHFADGLVRAFLQSADQPLPPDPDMIKGSRYPYEVTREVSNLALDRLYYRTVASDLQKRFAL